MRGASLHPAERCFLDSQNQRENDGLSAGNLSDDIKVSLSISFLPLFSLFSTIWMAAELCNHWTKWTLEMLPHLKGWFISYYSSHFTGRRQSHHSLWSCSPYHMPSQHSHGVTLGVRLHLHFGIILTSSCGCPPLPHSRLYPPYHVPWYDIPYQY